MSHSEKIGVMVCGHGSRNRGAVSEFAQLADQLKSRFKSGLLTMVT